MTPEQYKAHVARSNHRTAQRERNQQVSALLESVVSTQRREQSQKAFQAKGRLPKGQMNKTEQAYAALLDREIEAGAVLGWKFHPLRVRLAKNTYYEIDFLVLKADGHLEIHEIKGGFTTEKGQMKIKLCVEVMPWIPVIKCTKQKDGTFTRQIFEP
jgi:hypothetical protein